MRFERATCIIRAQPVMLESVSTPTRPYPPSSSAKERRLGSPRRVYLCSLNLAKLPILIKIKTSPTVQNLAVYNPFPRANEYRDASSSPFSSFATRRAPGSEITPSSARSTCIDRVRAQPRMQPSVTLERARLVVHDPSSPNPRESHSIVLKFVRIYVPCRFRAISQRVETQA